MLTQQMGDTLRAPRLRRRRLASGPRPTWRAPKGPHPAMSTPLPRLDHSFISLAAIAVGLADFWLLSCMHAQTPDPARITIVTFDNAQPVSTLPATCARSSKDVQINLAQRTLQG